MPRKVKVQNEITKVRKQIVRRSREQVQTILDEVDSLRKSGSTTLTAALKKVGVSYNNYNYWIKRRAQGAMGTLRAVAGGHAKSGGVMKILQEMTNNRVERQRLEKAVRSLDAQFIKLKRKLERR